MSETDAENRLGTIHADDLPHVVDGGLTELRIPGPVTDEQTIKIWKTHTQNPPINESVYHLHQLIVTAVKKKKKLLVKLKLLDS